MTDAPRMDLTDFATKDLVREIHRRSVGNGPPGPGLLAEADSGELTAAFQARADIIYGEDDRLDIYQLPPASPVRTDAACVMLVLSARYIEPVEDGQAELFTVVFGEQIKLCPNEKFLRQRCVPRLTGTAFLVAPNMVATAAHCLNGLPREDICFLPGFKMIDQNNEPLLFPLPDVHRISRIIWLDETKDGALLVLDRPVRDSQPGRVRIRGRVPDGSDVHVIGHPEGLPMKYADDAEAFVPSGKTPSFQSNLDVFPGNSGSPVFNSDSHIIEGIVYEAPENPFEWNGTCYESRHVGPSEKPFVNVLHSGEFAPLVPGYTMAVASHSGLPMAVQDGSLRDGAPIVQQTFTGENHQWFRIEPLPQGWSRIIAAHSGKALTVDGDPLEPGARIVQSTWTGADRQQFTIKDSDLVHTRIIPRLRPALSLDVFNNSPQTGNPVIQWTTEDQSNQLWIRGTPIVNVHSGQVADIRDRLREQGSPLIQYPYNGGYNQIFQVLWVRGNLYRIKVNGTGMVWTAGTTQRGGTVVRMTVWVDLPEQLFDLIPVGTGAVNIRSSLTGLMLQPQDSEGGYIIDALPASGELQQWHLQVTAPE